MPGALTACVGTPLNLQAARPSLNNLSIRPGTTALPMNANSLVAHAITPKGCIVDEQRQPQLPMTSAEGMYFSQIRHL